ncbi:hypothetical protein C8Q74DRAFT_861099 [Fomes fomentarius]|nr:hypothetical protein C8Q74DRAFT_861099 [Fomes fomentarius]
MAAISAGSVSLVSGSALGTNTITTSSAIVSPTWITSIPNNSELAQRIQDATDMLNMALGAVVIGLVLASITFGIVWTKAVSYFRGRNKDSGLVRATVASLILVNAVQLIATVHAVYRAVVVDFGRLSSLLDNEWSILFQIFFMTVAATIAQMFFTFRLHAIKHNIFLTMITLFFTTLQLAMAIYSVVLLYDNGYAAVLLLRIGEAWPLMISFSVPAGINIVLAVVGYVWMQKPYVFRKQGRTTLADELEYWTVKSLFGCAIILLFNTIAVAVMAVNMIWLAATFVLGNLFTLSVLLHLDGGPSQVPVVIPLANTSASESYRASTTTLTNDIALWEDTIKAQAIKASLPTVAKVCIFQYSPWLSIQL